MTSPNNSHIVQGQHQAVVTFWLNPLWSLKQFFCENCFFIGKKGTYNGSSGLTIAYLSGIENNEGKSGEIHFSQQDVTSLLLPVSMDTKFQGVDILITSQWPKSVDRYGIPLVCI